MVENSKWKKPPNAIVSIVKTAEIEVVDIYDLRVGDFVLVSNKKAQILEIKENSETHHLYLSVKLYPEIDWTVNLSTKIPKYSKIKECTLQQYKLSILVYNNRKWYNEHFEN